MVGSASGGEHRNMVVPANAREIFAEPWNHFVRDEVFPFLGAEDAMNENVGIFVGHPANIHIS